VTPTPPPIEQAHLREFSRRLRAWFRKHGRDLPWRRTRDPYHVLVSELMLQQTQVSRVVDYYERFLTRFPTLDHVAEAPQRHVVSSWAGLGYYARARNLHTLARRVTRDGGPIPADPSALRALPGIGAYTAGAVASFAYERRAALVDTNVARVLHRAFTPGTDPKSAAGHRIGWQIAERLLPRTGRAAWVHNQALMELGALVCTARVRHCARCPVARLCATRQADAGTADQPTPVRRAPARRRIAARGR
jgi:A/G-specific adenine glycosylase